MKILALEFSSALRSVAVARQKAAGVPPEILETAISGEPRASPFPLVAEVLAASKTAPEEIELIGVGLGPGSYTGIRTAIAVAQGWQLARGVRLTGVSSVQCMAQRAWVAGLRGRIGVVIDAQRGEFYLGLYDLRPEGPAESEPLRLITANEAGDLASLAYTGCTVVGNNLVPAFPAAHQVFPDAEILAALAAMRTDDVPGETLEPIYLRAVNFVKAPPPRVMP